MDASVAVSAYWVDVVGNIWDMPKSISLGIPSADITIFDYNRRIHSLILRVKIVHIHTDFKSPWTISRACKCDIPFAIPSTY